MVLPMDRADTDRIQLVGRWRRDKIMRYLNMNPQTFTSELAVRMVQHGDYALTPPAHGV